MWESHAVVERDFSKPLREATRFVAFRSGGISTAGLFFAPRAALFAAGGELGLAAAGAGSGCPVSS